MGPAARRGAAPRSASADSRCAAGTGWLPVCADRGERLGAAQDRARAERREDELEICADLATDSLEAVPGLLQDEPEHALVVVAPADDVVERREAVLLTIALHLIELLPLELR